MKARTNKRLLMILVTMGGMVAILSLCSVLAFGRGRREGMLEGALAATSVQSQRLLGGLVLIRSGAVDEGVARLEYCLDQGVVAIGEAPPSLSDSLLRAKYLAKVFEFRREYPRIPYQGRWRDKDIPSKADELLRQYSKGH